MVEVVSTFRKIDVPLRVKTFNQAEGTFSGYLSTWSLDMQQDRIQPGAFKKTLAVANSARTQRGDKFLYVILWQHQPHEPIGAIVEAQEDEIGLKVQGFLDLDCELGRRAFSAVSKGYVSAMSIGYRTVKDRMLSDGTRLLEQVELLEASLVTFPANTEARVGSIKTLDALVKDLVKEMALVARKHGAREKEQCSVTMSDLMRAWYRGKQPEPYSITPDDPMEDRKVFEAALRRERREEDVLWELTPGSKAFNREVERRQRERVEKQLAQKAALEAERKAQAERQAAMGAETFTAESFSTATGLDIQWVRAWLQQSVTRGLAEPIDGATMTFRGDDVRRMAKRDHELFEGQFRKIALKRAYEELR